MAHCAIVMLGLGILYFNYGMQKKPQLRLIASTWSLMDYPGVGRKEWSADRKVREIKRAGFDGLTAHIKTPIMKAAVKHRFPVVGNIDMGSVAEVEPKLREFKRNGVKHINVQLCDHDTSTEDALRVTKKIIEVGAKLGLKPAIEFHRDTCTETPEKGYALADSYRKSTGTKLLMNFDHSHPAIIKHLTPDAYWPRLGVRLDLLTMGEMIHFRPFNGHHCQIPITDGKNKLSKEFKEWLPFCDKVIQAWLKKAGPGKEFLVVPELGPKTSGYALSYFPDVWKDVQVLTREIRKIWSRRLKQWKP
jgi:hypothetical protein